MNYYIFALLAAFFFGLAPIFGKIGLEGVSPALALCIRSFIISGIMLVWLLFNTYVSPLTDVNMSGWVFIALEGICAALLGQLLYYYALKSGDASVVVPLIASFPLVTFIIATLFLGDKISITKVCGILFTITGIILLRI
ncbi:MAG: EamA family transporter [Methanobacteriaceae archaeon]|nr:EamA family transporter [Methanobacteriaceae archaeon]MDP2835927.1 EamA family transporter [Methanobacteriaceae archaeon]MDP3035302.1 EamA family transporter [Methanobacteriaceae archaeon]MDP3485710.1 EamA family transporter [Methanobacteriaceae archaeon]MDP3623777.1 EamA family transporter [Methanobacteriaceae archaeon]